MSNDYADPEICTLAVWETERLTYHCRCDGKFCEVHGDWDKCRLNFPRKKEDK